MRRLLSKQQQRQLSIIEYLSERDGYTPLSQIAKFSHCSIRIIHNDFKLFKNLNNIFEIDTNKSGAKLIFKASAKLEDIFQYFIRSSLAFLLLKELFISDSNTKEYLCNKLFISRTTLIDLIRNSNPILKEQYSFEINPVTLRLEGKEKCIRLFFLRYFYNSTNLEEWPFNDYFKRTEIFLFAQKLLNHFYNKNDDIEAYQFTMLICINYIRFTQGNHLSPTELGERDLCLNLIFSNMENEIENRFNSIFNLDFTDTILSEIFFPYINNNIIFTGISDLNIYANDVNNKSFLYFQHNILNLINSIDYNIENSFQIFQTVHNNIFTFPFNITHNFSLLQSNIINYIDNNNVYMPIDIKKIETFLNNYLIYLQIEPSKIMLEQLKFVFFSVWKGFVSQISSKTKVKIAIISNLGNNHLNLITNYLKIFVENKNVTIHPLHSKKMLNETFQLVISNFTIPPQALKNDQKQLLIQDFPTKENIKSIQCMIIDLL